MIKCCGFQGVTSLSAVGLLADAPTFPCQVVWCHHYMELYISVKGEKQGLRQGMQEIQKAF